MKFKDFINNFAFGKSKYSEYSLEMLARQQSCLHFNSLLLNFINFLEKSLTKKLIFIQKSDKSITFYKKVTKRCKIDKIYPLFRKKWSKKDNSFFKKQKIAQIYKLFGKKLNQKAIVQVLLDSFGAYICLRQRPQKRVYAEGCSPSALNGVIASAYAGLWPAWLVWLGQLAGSAASLPTSCPNQPSLAQLPDRPQGSEAAPGKRSFPFQLSEAQPRLRLQSAASCLHLEKLAGLGQEVLRTSAQPTFPRLGTARSWMERSSIRLGGIASGNPLFRREAPVGSFAATVQRLL